MCLGMSRDSVSINLNIITLFAHLLFFGFLYTLQIGASFFSGCFGNIGGGTTLLSFAHFFLGYFKVEHLKAYSESLLQLGL